MRDQLLLLAFLILISNSLVSQNLGESINYTVSDGLPSNTIYAIEQDSLGYIWLGTDKGLSRFDGTEFVNYSPKDGLADTEILKFFKDSKNRIWYYTLNGKIGYIKNGRLYTKETGSNIDPINHQITSIIEYNNQIYFSSRRRIFSYNDSLGEFISDNTIYLLPKYFRSHSGLLLKTDTSILKVSKTESGHLSLWDSHNLRNIGFMISNNHKLYGISSLDDTGKESRYLHDSSYLIEYDISKKRLQKTILNIGLTHNMKNHTDSSFFIFAASGVYQYQLANHELTQISPVYKPTDILETKNGDLLITTYNNGLLLFHESPNTNCLIQTDSIKSSYLINNKIYYETLFAKIGSYDSTGSINNIDLSDLRSIEDTKSGEPLIIGYHQIIYGKTEITTYLSAVTNDYENLWYAKLDNIYQLKITPDSLMPVKTIKKPVQGKIRHMTNIDSCHFLLFNDLNTYHFDICSSNIDLLPINSRINEMVKARDGTILMATNGDGIIAFSEKHKISTINTNDGLTDNFIDKIVVGNNNIWALNRKGVDIIQFPVDSGEVNIQHLWDLPGTVRSISPTSSGILATTSTGIYHVNENYSLPYSQRPVVFIDWYSINSSKRNYESQNIQISPKINQIQFRFSSPLTNIGEKASYRYRVINQNNLTEWIDISDNTLTFANLQPGHVTLEIQAKSNELGWSESTLVNYEKLPYWYEQAWLKWLFAFLSSLLLITIFGRIRSSIHYRKRLKSEKLFAELSARKAQFKSHFVFNSINSVRNYLLNNDQKTSDDYLVAYSKLMRKMLDVSNKVLIPLNEELELIEYYMSLEQMRLRHQFEYQIEIAKDILTADLKCPAMITQVFVENAIWHGIMPLNDSGFINIFVALQQQDHYVIRITDDGVGFDQTDIKQKDQTSWGTSIVKDKTKLIKETYNVDLKIEIESKKGVGTEVSILLPINF